MVFNAWYYKLPEPWEEADYQTIPSSSGGCAEGIDNLGPSEGLHSGKCGIEAPAFLVGLLGRLLQCCNAGMLSEPQRGG